MNTYYQNPFATNGNKYVYTEPNSIYTYFI